MWHIYGYENRETKCIQIDNFIEVEVEIQIKSFQLSINNIAIDQIELQQCS